MRWLLASLASLASLGCHAEPIDVYQPDTGVVDAGACRASYTRPDRELCVGHDEDCDGMPDECDDCPGLPGATCPSISGAWRRAFFDSFARDAFPRKLRSIGAGHPLQLGDDRVVGGSSNGPGSSDTPMLVFEISPKPAEVSATTAFSVPPVPGTIGVIVRVVGDSKVRFVGCLADFEFAPRLVAVRSIDGCTATGCPLADAEAADAGVLRAFTPIPAWSKALEPLAVRATLRGTRLECRAFRPDLRPTWDGVEVALDLPEVEAGDVGLLTHHADADFHWLDVLVPAAP